MLTDSSLIEPILLVPFVAITAVVLAGLFNPILSILLLSCYGIILLGYGAIAAFEERDSTFLMLVPLLLILEHASYLIGTGRGTLKGRWTRAPAATPTVVFSKTVSREPPIKIAIGA